MDELSKKPDFVESGLASVVTEVAFALAVHLDDSWHASGTAVSVGGGLLMTAKHVVEDYWERLGTGGRLRGSLSANFRIVARQMLGAGKELAYWRATRCWTSPATDIAFILVVPLSESAARYRRWRVPQLQLNPPQTGEKVVAFGYHTPEVSVTRDANRLRVEWDDHPSVSVGEVTEVHPVLRDRHLLRFPCFQTNSRFDGGMSGGPIFNDQGQVCGLVCATMVGDPQAGHTSYGLTLWPAMGMLINIGVDGAVSETPIRVLEIAKAGVISALGWESVSLVPIDDGVEIRYTPP